MELPKFQTENPKHLLTKTIYYHHSLSAGKEVFRGS